MNRDVFPWYRGGDLFLGLEVETGALDGSETIRAVGKPIRFAGDVAPGDAIPIAFEFSASFVPPAGDVLAVWALTVAAEIGNGLPLGFYLVDANLVVGGVPIQTRPIVVEILETVTDPAP